MLAKKNKLNTQEHKLLAQKGKRKHTPYFSLQFLKLENNNQIKCAVVVPKKLYKKAVSRNKNRRLLFGLLKKLYPQFKEGYFFSLILRKKLTNEEISLIEQELYKIFEDFLKQ